MSQYYRYKENGSVYLVNLATQCGGIKNTSYGVATLCVYYKVAHPHQDGTWNVSPPNLDHPFIREDWEFETKFERLLGEEIRAIGLPLFQHERRHP